MTKKQTALAVLAAIAAEILFFLAMLVLDYMASGPNGNQLALNVIERVWFVGYGFPGILGYWMVEGHFLNKRNFG